MFLLYIWPLIAFIRFCFAGGESKTDQQFWKDAKISTVAYALYTFMYVLKTSENWLAFLFFLIVRSPDSMSPENTPW